MSELETYSGAGATLAPLDDGADAKLRQLTAAWLLGFDSDRTRTAYGRDVRAWLAWCDEYQLDPLAARRGHIDAYARQLEHDGYARTTRARKLAALASWYTYLVSEDMLGASPVEHIRRPKVSANHKPTLGLEKDEADALIAAADADGARSRAIVAVLLTMGLRISETLQLNVDDFDEQRGHRTATIYGKGDRVDLVAMPAPAVRAVDEYLAGRTSGPVFLTRTGRRWDRPSVDRTLKRLARRAGLRCAGKISPHWLRHTAITLALDAGATLRDAQDFARHADPRTTRMYDEARGSLDRSSAYKLAAYLYG